uniref:glutathione transferase n=1 Tax=Acrobeloides nanus TaxID=290746 RepID=A0A914CC98_9BILA
MVHYKLQYFWFRGLGEPIRLLFHYLGQEFEDEIIKIEDWPAYKPKTPYGHVPILFIDGKKSLAESRPIARYIAKEHNLAGKDNFEQERLNSIVDYLLDWFRNVFPYFLTKMGFKTYQDFLHLKKSDGLDAIVDQLYKDQWLPTIQQELPVLEKLVKDSTTGFLSKDGVTWADFFVAEFIYSFQQIDPEIKKKHPELINYMNRFYELPGVKEHVAKRTNG